MSGRGEAMPRQPLTDTISSIIMNYSLQTSLLSPQTAKPTTVSSSHNDMCTYRSLELLFLAQIVNLNSGKLTTCSEGKWESSFYYIRIIIISISIASHATGPVDQFCGYQPKAAVDNMCTDGWTDGFLFSSSFLSR